MLFFACFLVVFIVKYYISCGTRPFNFYSCSITARISSSESKYRKKRKWFVRNTLKVSWMTKSLKKTREHNGRCIFAFRTNMWKLVQMYWMKIKHGISIEIIVEIFGILQRTLKSKFRRNNRKNATVNNIRKRFNNKKIL